VRKQANGGAKDRSVADHEQSSSLRQSVGPANGKTHEASRDVAMTNEDQSMSLAESSQLIASNKKAKGGRREETDAAQKPGKSVA